MVQHGGLVYYGGLIGASAACVVFAWRRRFPLWKLADILAPGVALGSFFGRWGCLMNGCCYGRPTTSAVGHPIPRRPRNPSRRRLAALRASDGDLRFAAESGLVRRPGVVLQAAEVRRASFRALPGLLCGFAFLRGMLPRGLSGIRPGGRTDHARATGQRRHAAGRGAAAGFAAQRKEARRETSSAGRRHADE